MIKFFSFVLSSLVLISFSTLGFADQSNILGTLQIGKTIWGTSQSVSVPVRYFVENRTEDAWDIKDSLSSAYVYVVYNVQTGQQVARGYLQDTHVSMIESGQSDVFAVGNVVLNNPISGYYRVFVHAPMFQDASFPSVAKELNAGGVFVVQ